MAAKLIKGTEIREEILKEITAEVKEIKEKHGVVPRSEEHTSELQSH